MACALGPLVLRIEIQRTIDSWGTVTSVVSRGCSCALSRWALPAWVISLVETPGARFAAAGSDRPHACPGAVTPVFTFIALSPSASAMKKKRNAAVILICGDQIRATVMVDVGRIYPDRPLSSAKALRGLEAPVPTTED